MADIQDSSRAMLFNEEKYKDFSDIDPDNLQQPSHSCLYRGSPACRTALVLFSIFAILLLPTFIIGMRFKALHRQYDQCGTTATDARARGCVFEITGFMWLPKECWDSNTENEFLDHVVNDNIKFYRHNNFTEEVALAEVRRGDGPGFFVRQDFHRMHCNLLIKKFHRAVDEGRKFDGVIYPMEHTTHCLEQLSAPPGEPEGVIQFSQTKFPYCGKPGGYNLEWPIAGTWS